MRVLLFSLHPLRKSLIIFLLYSSVYNEFPKEDLYRELWSVWLRRWKSRK